MSKLTPSINSSLSAIQLTGAQASPLAMSVASTRKRSLKFMARGVKRNFRAPRSLQAGTLALQSNARFYYLELRSGFNY